MKWKRWAGSEIHQVGRNKRTWQEIGYGPEGRACRGNVQAILRPGEVSPEVTGPFPLTPLQRQQTRMNTTGPSNKFLSLRPPHRAPLSTPFTIVGPSFICTDVVKRALEARTMVWILTFALRSCKMRAKRMEKFSLFL